MPNLRTTPASDISREFQTGSAPDVRTRPYIFTDFVIADSTTTVSASGNERIEILAPSGYIYEITNGIIKIEPISGATEGEQRCNLMALGQFTVTYGRSTYNKQLYFIASHWIKADIEALPTDNQLNAFQSLVADEDSPLVIQYYNDTNAEQTQTRMYRFMVKKVKV